MEQPTLLSDADDYDSHKLIKQIRWVAWHTHNDSDDALRRIRDLILEYDGIFEPMDSESDAYRSAFGTYIAGTFPDAGGAE